MSRKRHYSDSPLLVRDAQLPLHEKRAFSTGVCNKPQTNNEFSQEFETLSRIARDQSIDIYQNNLSSHSVTEALLLREELESIQSICISNQTALELLEKELDESRKANERITEIIESLNSSSLPVLKAKERDLSSLLDVASFLTEQNLLVPSSGELLGKYSINSLHIFSASLIQRALSSYGLFYSHLPTLKF